MDLFEKTIRDLLADPNGPPLTVIEAAAALKLSPTRIRELVLTGMLRGRIEDGRVVDVDRGPVRTARRFGTFQR